MSGLKMCYLPLLDNELSNGSKVALQGILRETLLRLLTSSSNKFRELLVISFYIWILIISNYPNFWLKSSIIWLALIYNLRKFTSTDYVNHLDISSDLYVFSYDKIIYIYKPNQL